MTNLGVIRILPTDKMDDPATMSDEECEFLADSIRVLSWLENHPMRFCKLASWKGGYSAGMSYFNSVEVFEAFGESA